MPTDPPRSPWPRVALALAFTGAVVAFYALGRQYLDWASLRGHLDAWRAYADDHLVLSLAVFCAAYVAVTALSLPVALPLTVVGAALFGRALGTAAVSAASTLGATLAFLGSRYLLRDWVQARFGGRLAALNRGVERDGPYFLLTLRLVPAVPFWLINLGMGLTPMRAGMYALVSWAGMLPGTALIVNAAAALTAADSLGGLLTAGNVASLAALAAVPLAVRKALQWRRRGEE